MADRDGLDVVGPRRLRVRRAQRRCRHPVPLASSGDRPVEHRVGVGAGLDAPLLEDRRVAARS